MKAQIVFLSIAVLAINSPKQFHPASVTESSDKMPVTVVKKQNTAFAFFRTHHQGKGVTAEWGLTSNAGVTCFIVERTYEDPADPYSVWEDIAVVPVDQTRSFKYTDSSVFPGYINYRIVAFTIDGSAIVSDVSGVRIVSH